MVKRSKLERDEQCRISKGKGLYIKCAKNDVRKVGRDDAVELYHSAEILGRYVGVLSF